MATEKNLNNLIINKVENQAVYDYMKINNLINADELYFISGADDNATETESGLMSAEDKIKLDGIQEGAEINQNAFSNVTIGSTTISADSKTDTLTLVAGSNVTITPDSTNDKITIAATDTTYNAAGSSLGLVKSGGDVNISNGIITVNDNSHSHTIDNVDNLQSVLNGKVNAVDGKGLSTNDLTNTLKSNYDAAYTHSQQTHAPANAEKNVIVGIQKNGTDLSVNSSTRKVNITIPTKTSDLTNDSNFATTTALDTKVDKITGKSLSTNDYTTQEKTKLSNIEDGANKTVVDTALSSTSTNPVQNKVINTKFNTIQSNIDNKVPSSRTINGKALTDNITLSASDVGALPSSTVIPSIDGLATETYVNNKVAGLVDSAPSTLDTLNELAAALGDDPNFATTIATQIGGKVDKVNGKGLSTNDYTTVEKQKLANIANGANNYTLPVATSSTLGGIKSGTDITVNSSGNVSVNNGAVTTEKLADSSITRTKLAQDALYSPIMVCSGSSYDLSQNECGKTLINDPTNSSAPILEYNIGKGNSQWISAGSEFAFISFSGQGVNLCFWDNILVALPGESSLKNAPLKLRISENYGMVALKKIYHNPEGIGDVWLVTGNVEVVS